VTTTRIDHEVTRRRYQRAEPTLATFGDDFDRALELQLSTTLHIKFPNPEYQQDPERFFVEVLGVQPWSKQVEILNAVRDNARVAIASGHKVSKSHTAAGIALWFYCSFPDARVVMTSTTSRQVDQILWRELRMMRARSGRCVPCKLQDPSGLIIKRPCPHSALIDGEQGDLARTGLKSDDFREIVGFTAKEAEAVAGISGLHLLYIADEASGIDNTIFEAIDGNRAGGAKIVMFSNPTRNEGEFFDAFTSKSRFYFTLRISSEETPNAVSGKILIPGLATRDWIEEKKLEWGEDSPMYRIRVKGEHAVYEDAKIFSIHLIAESEQRWADTADAGRLYIGIDPAGETGLGDDSAFCVRRGFKMLALRTHRGLNDEQHLVQLLLLIQEFALPRETPVVVVDRDGLIGSTLFGRLRAYVNEPPHAQAFDVASVRASDRAHRRPHVYDRMRDELAANLEQWFRDGGAILEDARLAHELHSMEFAQAINGRIKLIPKDKLRKMLGRSPDRYDSLALSCWEPLSLQAGFDVAARVVAAREAARHNSLNTPAARVVDPYSGMNAFKRK
jgi:hypothetical protein